MLPEYAKRRVYENVEVSKDIYCLKVEGSYCLTPGQFFMLRCWDLEPLLSRPISIHDADEKSVSFLYEVKGSGTRSMSRLKAGDSIKLLGPIGNGFDVSAIRGRAAIVTGGIGLAPMLYTSKCIKDAAVDLYAGFRDDVYMLGKFKNFVKEIKISTDSGKYGHKGYVTDIFVPEMYDVVLCCGPVMMMKKAAQMCKNKDIPIFVSMEAHMACGIGACLTCTCKTDTGNKRTCKDGPVFDGREVIFGD